MRPVQTLQPCARCEQELPLACFSSPEAVFCKRCTEEVNNALRKKYNIIKAAHFRAQLRQSTRKLQQHLKNAPVAGVGD